MWQPFLFAAFALTAALGQTVNLQADNTEWKFGFGVDYENNQFLLDGKPFRYVAGSFHYFRAPRQYWRDRLRKMRAAGLNAVSTYVEWSFHQPEINTWRWSGDADLVEFLNIAQQEDLFVLLRPGPYICAERDLGGLPYWLLTYVPDIKLRTNDSRYMEYSEIYLNEVLERVKPYLRGNGGPVIMVQVENEYGSYKACDTDYTNKLRDIIHRKVENKALLYTTDGASASMLRCGFVPGVYATVDFGSGSNVTKSFEIMRFYQPRGPLVNSEYYPGWLTHWGEPFQRVKSRPVAEKLDEMLAVGASVNFYMFYGGTNFAFTSGANGGVGKYDPQLTSYDYDAPLTEAGDPTEKYFEIRKVIAKYLPMPNMSLPTASPKGDYGPVLLEPIVGLMEPLGRRLFASSIAQAEEPLSFEALALPHWLVLYETHLPQVYSDPAIFSAITRDRALIYIDDILSGTLSRTSAIFSVPVQDNYGRHLKVLVENQGRLNFGNDFHDFKGISNVSLSGVRLSNWNMTGFRLNDVSPLKNLQPTTMLSGVLRYGPVFLRGHFTVTGQPLDTYLDTTGWGKGVAYINGHNLGRYWPVSGPQITLYVPATFLKEGQNELVLLELEYLYSSRKMKLQRVPNLDGNVNVFEAERETQKYQADEIR
ncbi:hypothetical protein KM043_014699 [Ampulex compressa]|nr:hypothetical protein KM043_014699 [Ampulex compressa]